MAAGGSWALQPPGMLGGPAVLGAEPRCAWHAPLTAACCTDPAPLAQPLVCVRNCLGRLVVTTVYIVIVTWLGCMLPFFGDFLALVGADICMIQSVAGLGPSACRPTVLLGCCARRHTPMRLGCCAQWVSLQGGMPPQFAREPGWPDVLMRARANHVCPCLQTGSLGFTPLDFIIPIVLWTIVHPT